MDLTSAPARPRPAATATSPRMAVRGARSILGGRHTSAAAFAFRPCNMAEISERGTLPSSASPIKPSCLIDEEARALGRAVDLMHVDVRSLPRLSYGNGDG